MTILLSAVAALALGSVPSALAMNTPNVSTIPGTTVLGATATITVTADPLKLDHDRSTLSIYDPDVTAMGVNFIGGAGNCRTAPIIGPGVQWELRHLDGTTPFVYAMTAATDSFSTTFGTDGNVAITGVTAGTTVSTLTAKWTDVSGGADPAVFDIVTDQNDPFDGYLVRSCGFEEVPPGGQGATTFNAEGLFKVAEPIGGEILSINTTALLIAGLSTSAIWMVPAIGAVAGTAVTLYKLRQK